MKRGIFAEAVGVVCCLLTIKDPYDEPHRPAVLTAMSTDERGNPVLHVQADNYVDVCNLTQGTTYPGDVYRSAVHISGRDWEIRVEPFNTGSR